MFLLDSNVFIEASRTYYWPSIAPKYWTWLAEQHEAGKIASIEAVRSEINDGKGGHLKEWAKTLPSTFWLEPTDSSVEAMTRVTAWTMHKDRLYTEAARKEFLRVADYFLLSEALGGNHVVITREQSAPLAKKRVLIPDACIAFHVPYEDPFKLYQKLGLCLG